MSLHERIGPSFPAMRTLIQLANPHSNCFVNCVLQILYNTPAIEDWIRTSDSIISSRGLRERSESMIIGHFIKIYIDSMNAPQNEVWYEPNCFLDHVFGPRGFQRGASGDAGQFFLWLCQAIDESVQTLNYDLGQPLLTSFAAHFWSLLSTTSKTERRSTTSQETLPALPIPILGPHFGRNFLGFLKCTMADGLEIERTLLTLPRILVLSFASARFNPETRTVEKVWNRFQIPTRFEASDTSGVKFYDLMGVAVHTGESPCDGHYVCVVQTCEHWLIADDANIWGIGDELENFLLYGALPGYSGTSPHLAVYQMMSI
jgi:hypothetical protein